MGSSGRDMTSSVTFPSLSVSGPGCAGFAAAQCASKSSSSAHLLHRCEVYGFVSESRIAAQYFLISSSQGRSAMKGAKGFGIAKSG